jgi:hypothetical protein
MTMSATAAPPASPLQIDEPQFSAGFSHTPMAVDHALAGHPLLSLEALAELADRLPLKSIERHRADLPVHHPDEPENLEGPPSQTVLEMATGNVWMVMWYVEQDPRYKALLDECLDAVEAHVGDAHGGMRRRHGFMFISAPNATTPIHMDPEENLLLQVHGTKTMNIGRFPDASQQQHELDRYFAGGPRNLERVPELDRAFEMPPGVGTYVPPFAPHWVVNGAEPSVSFSITFRTAGGERTEHVHQLNARLRRMGVSPRPAGVSAAVDRAKAGAFLAYNRARRRALDEVHADGI